MNDPFVIDGPTGINFSFGRSSARMVHEVLRANPPDVLRRHAKFMCANTGKEDEASLVFGNEVDLRWLRPLGLSLIWLEYLDDAGVGVTTFEDAARSGEPFEAVIAQRGGALPNRVARFCSSEMKTRTMHRYLRSIGWTEWDTFLGIRADEPTRVAKFRANPSPESKSEEVHMPLAIAGIGAHDVGAFWKAQPFDLGLPNHNGKTMHGNCDLCFLKPASQVLSLIAEKPSRAIWWATQETKAEAAIPPRIREVPQYERRPKDAAVLAAERDAYWSQEDADGYEEPGEFEVFPKLDANGAPVVKRYEETPTAARFRDDRPSYAAMYRQAALQTDAFGYDPDEAAVACFCGD